MSSPRPHFLGIDDAPFDKAQPAPVPLVAVMTEGPDQVEAVMVGAFPVDGAHVTEYLLEWLGRSTALPGIQAVLLGGITIAGLALVDVSALARGLDRPVLIATRRDTARSDVATALRTAGLDDRLGIFKRAPPARLAAPGLHIACAGIDWHRGAELARQSVRKGRFPEPLRLAHMIGQAMVLGRSKGRP